MMKRSAKRLLSGLFTAAFLFTGVSSVFAKDYSDVTTENPARDAIDILSEKWFEKKKITMVLSMILKTIFSPVVFW